MKSCLKKYFSKVGRPDLFDIEDPNYSEEYIGKLIQDPRNGRTCSIETGTHSASVWSHDSSLSDFDFKIFEHVYKSISVSGVVYNNFFAYIAQLGYNR